MRCLKLRNTLVGHLNLDSWLLGCLSAGARHSYVLRVLVPAPSLLSIQSASQVQEVYQDSPVNIRAKNGIGVPDFALRNPRFSQRDNLPFNYHALDAVKLGINTEDGESA